SQGFGICRDFAHLAVALCRCFNLPARYVTGHLPDVGFQDSGSPMDFHAYMQVYVGNRWHSFDARFNVPRTGRIDIACGFDAVECAFSTLYGAATLAWFNVWNYQVDRAQVKLGDPVDLTKRLDGTPNLRFA
ncbi:MAG TPA: transglutaminase family protein, partial [Chthoniobacterales bacterium]